MESLILYLQGLPYFTEISTVVTVASVVTMSLRDNVGDKYPILKQIWPILNWFSLNVFHNENKSSGMGKGKGK
jgi:hypothetical protein